MTGSSSSSRRPTQPTDGNEPRREKPAATLSVPQLLAWRLERQHLIEPATPDSLEAVAEDMLGAHAQLSSAAALQLRARIRDLDADQVRGALLDRRTLVKSWAMRGTLHYLPSSIYPTVVAALSGRDNHRKAFWLKAFGVTLEQMEAILTGVPAALDGKALTREELSNVIAEKIGKEVGARLRSAWGTLLKPVAFTGGLCFGPSQGQRVTFVRPDQWVAGWPAQLVSAEDGMREVCRRYIHAFGPTTHADFSRWWGMDPAAGRRAFALLDGELAEVEVEGSDRRATVLAADIPALARTVGAGAGDSVRLLPNFDPYLMGSHPRNDFMPEAHRTLIFQQAGAWVKPVLLVGGKVAGTWTTEKRGRRLDLRVEPFERLAAAVRTTVEAEAHDLFRFIGAEGTLAIA